MSSGVKPQPLSNVARDELPRPPRTARVEIPDTSAWSSDAERACAYVIDRARVASGALFHQGPRVPPLATESTSPLVRFIAERRMHRIETAIARALVAWDAGFPVELFTSVPTARRVLALQSEGRRCVSLLPDGAKTHPHADSLAFALHDLCHLDKFIDVEHHRGQVGFFFSLERAVASDAWATFEKNFDAQFAREWEHVAADMNGSAVFLFAALKMKLKMGARRAVAARDGGAPDAGGPLTPSEARAYAAWLDELLSLLSLHGDVAEAARRTSARRDDPKAAWLLLGHFEQVGEEALRLTRRPQ
jgi:hypothetical protein